MVKKIIIIVSVLINVFCISYILTKHNNDNSLGNNYLYQILSSDYRLIIKNDNNRILTNNIQIENSNNEKIFKDSILNNKKLIVRYSNLDCNVCVDSLIRYSKLLAEKIGKDKIVILAKNTDKRDFHLFSRINKNELNIYQVNSKLTNLDDLGFPYMFIYNENNTISHIFIPHKEYPKMFTWYFDIVTRYLDNNEEQK